MSRGTRAASSSSRPDWESAAPSVRAPRHGLDPRSEAGKSGVRLTQRLDVAALSCPLCRRGPPTLHDRRGGPKGRARPGPPGWRCRPPRRALRHRGPGRTRSRPVPARRRSSATSGRRAVGGRAVSLGACLRDGPNATGRHPSPESTRSTRRPTAVQRGVRVERSQSRDLQRLRRRQQLHRLCRGFDPRRPRGRDGGRWGRRAGHPVAGRIRQPEGPGRPALRALLAQQRADPRRGRGDPDPGVRGTCAGPRRRPCWRISSATR